jgi:hypothetical protein
MDGDCGGESLQSAKVKVADVLVHGLQFTIVVDLIGWKINDYDSTKLGEYFHIAEFKLSDKEHAHWDPVIAVNRRLVDTLVPVGSRLPNPK